MRECEEADKRTIEILPRLEAMKVLSVREGDVLIVQTNQKLSQDTHNRIKEVVGSALPKRIRDKVSVLILEGGIGIGVLRAEEKT